MLPPDMEKVLLERTVTLVYGSKLVTKLLETLDKKGYYYVTILLSSMRNEKDIHSAMKLFLNLETTDTKSLRKAIAAMPIKDGKMALVLAGYDAFDKLEPEICELLVEAFSKRVIAAKKAGEKFIFIVQTDGRDFKLKMPK